MNYIGGADQELIHISSYQVTSPDFSAHLKKLSKLSKFIIRKVSKNSHLSNRKLEALRTTGMMQYVNVIN